uniref:Poly(A) polymerase catalytic subunit domain-containing protein n=1 Tax=viral metagenome TaxID=1070528 RepID=A0A6C0C7B9_9ZZZZ
MKCEKGLTFGECELAILRHAVDNIEKKTGRKMIGNPVVQEIISIVEKFLVKTQRVCYGGTAINNILPDEDQFYDKSVELPDYDFFSPEPLQDAKDLADIFYKQGFNEVEAKAGMHAGTFKVFVNFIPVADISFLPKELYKKIHKKSIIKSGIHYSPPDYLRMLMYLELSRPQGDASRWEKVLKRLTLLNKTYPLRGKDCDFMEIQRMFDVEKKLSEGMEKKIYYIVRDSLVNQRVVFFGAMANQMYLKDIKKFRNKNRKPIPDFDVLSLNPETTASILKTQLTSEGIKNVKIKKHNGVGEIIAPHYDVRVNGETVAFIYEPMACHSFNIISRGGYKIRIATLDTMLSFYLAFLYVNRPYYDPQRILCMSHYLFEVQQKHRLQQKGLLRRFSIDCYGDEKHTKEMVRSEKTRRYKELKKKKGSPEWEYFFLNYKPGEKEDFKTKGKTKKSSRGKSKRKTRKKKKKGIFNL